MRRSGGSLGQIPKPGHLQTRGFCVHPGSLTPLSLEGIHVSPATSRGVLLRRHLNAFFHFQNGEDAMSLLNFFTGQSADELVQYEPTSEDTITFGLRLFTIGGVVAIGLTVIALRYFA